MRNYPDMVLVGHELGNRTVEDRMTESGDMSLGQTLRACRIAAGHTQNSLASASGVSTRAISYLETGQVRRARRGTIEALLAVLDLTAEERSALLSHGRPAPGPAPSARAPSQLPPAVPGLIGREGSLAAVEAALGDGGVITVCGMPGAGKTAFAVEAATRAQACFPDGQLYLDLHGTGGQALSPGQALGFLLRSLLGADAVIPVATDERSALLRTTVAGRRVLMVLDNARDSAQVRPLLPAGPDCAVLVTSRNVLASLDVRHRVSLGVLSSAGSAELLTLLAGPGRLRDDPDGAAELLRWCGGLPLAIRIVAARLGARPGWPAGGLGRLLSCPNRRLSELAVGDLAVRAAFLDSYRLLAGPEQQLFGRLGLFPGASFDTATAAVLAGRPAEDTERLLEALAHASLIQPSGTPDRYRMHPLVRLFAAGQAAAGDPGARYALERLFNWYLRAMEQRSGGDPLIHPAGPAAGSRPRPAGTAAFRPAYFGRPASNSNIAKGLSMPE
jgi:transcriptional regulator with XRE-family HTH domain